MGTLFQVSGSPYSDWFEKRLWNKPPSTSVVSENAASPFGLRGSGKWLGNFSGLSNHMRVRRKYIKYFAAEQELNDTLCLMQTSTKHPFLLTFSRFIIKHHSSKCLQSLKEISTKKKKKKHARFILARLSSYIIFSKAGARFKSSLTKCWVPRRCPLWQHLVCFK